MIWLLEAVWGSFFEVMIEVVGRCLIFVVTLGRVKRNETAEVVVGSLCLITILVLIFARAAVSLQVPPE